MLENAINPFAQKYTRKAIILFLSENFDEKKFALAGNPPINNLRIYFMKTIFRFSPKKTFSTSK